MPLAIESTHSFQRPIEMKIKQGTIDSLEKVKLRQYIYKNNTSIKIAFKSEFDFDFSTIIFQNSYNKAYLPCDQT